MHYALQFSPEKAYSRYMLFNYTGKSAQGRIIRPGTSVYCVLIRIVLYYVLIRGVLFGWGGGGGGGGATCYSAQSLRRTLARRTDLYVYVLRL